jgi:hypothetical protein
MADESRIPSSMAPDATAIARASITADWGIQMLPRTRPVKTDLEPWVLEGIGKIVFLWAFAEWILIGMASDLKGIDRKQSRQVWKGRADEALQAISDALSERGLQKPPTFKKVGGWVSELGEIRNMVGHGIWVDDDGPGQVAVQRITGVWEADGEIVDTKKKTPGAEPVSEQWFKKQAAKIHECISDTKKLKSEIEALVAGG